MRTPPELLVARVPRYTSYPTAPHFHAGIGAPAFRSWLEELPEETGLSLYVHIPFCDTLCWFCGCHTRVVNRYSPVQGYLEWLVREIDGVADILGSARKVTHLHWGGGSPTLLSPADIGRLSDHLRRRFRIATDAEFAVEIDPRGLSDATIAALAAAGVTRASIGVQDCDPRVQRAINRIQPFEVTKSAIERLRDASITAINIDLIYGLPHQTTELVRRTIEATLALEPDRYAVFGYAHVPAFKKHQNLIPAEALPGFEERAAQFTATHALLTACGYAAIGLDHFAKAGDPLAVAQRAGTLRRNFQGYTTDQASALIGFGASSISSLPQGYVQNAADVPAWRRALAGGLLPASRGIRLSREDRLRAAVIERLMCDLEADVGALAERFGCPANHFAAELADLAPLEADGWIAVAGTRVSIRPEARAFTRIVASAFDAYLPKSTAIHAAAV